MSKNVCGARHCDAWQAVRARLCDPTSPAEKFLAATRLLPLIRVYPPGSLSVIVPVKEPGGDIVN